MPVIPRPRLVRTLSGQYHLDIFVRKLTDKMKCCRGFVAYWFFDIPEVSGEIAEVILGGYDHFVMRRSKLLRHCTGIVGFVGLLTLRKSDSEGVQRAAEVLAHERENRTRVDAGAEEEPDRHIAADLQAHCIFEELLILLDQFVFVWRLDKLGSRLPVPVNIWIAIFDNQKMAGRQFLDTTQQRVGRGNIAIAEEIAQCLLINHTRALPILQNRFDLGGKKKSAIDHCVIERLDTQVVTSDKEPF